MGPTLQSSETAGSFGNSTTQTVNLHAVRTFIALQFSGGIGMLVLLSTAFLSRKETFQRLDSSSYIPIKRSQAWYSFCISWIISCFAYCLLFFCGEQFNPDENPSYGVCLVQAALIYSSPPLTGATTFTLLLDVWWTFRTAVMGGRSGGTTVLMSLLIVPYVFWIALTLGFFIVGRADPQMVQRDLTLNPYCILSHPVPPLLACILTLAFALAIIALLINLAVTMYHIRRKIRQSAAHPTRALVLARDTDKTKGKALIVVMISVLYVINQTTSLGSNLSIAALPPIGVVIFGSQKDVLQRWLKLLQWPLPCLRRDARTSSNGSNQLTEYNAKVEILEMDFGPNIVGNDSRNGGPSLIRDAEEALVSPRKGVSFHHE
ncbi:hypothetical protein BDP27DRAFT_1446015 [Rhodocollybia butyracea]|uniref:Uncharacterized protein n=1 Tax=Rhodocollybia butyracea TaxID=206335 RepID=A0A9P5UAA1_9AGAR|nr:hypothetical protein BDP27DRAFT_1446015 [Rhodocollybia butyracea]